MSILLVAGICAICFAVGFFFWPAKRELIETASTPGEQQEKAVASVSKTNDFHKPGFNKRICSYLIDLLFISCVWVGFSFGLKINFPWWLAIVYWLLRDSFNGQSIGKILVGLQVIGEDDKVITPIEGIIRNIIITIPFISLLEYFVMVKDEQGQRWGDQFVQTKVNDLRPNVGDRNFLLISVLLAFLGIGLYYKFVHPEVQKLAQSIVEKTQSVQSKK